MRRVRPCGQVSFVTPHEARALAGQMKANADLQQERQAVPVVAPAGVIAAGCLRGPRSRLCRGIEISGFPRQRQLRLGGRGRVPAQRRTMPHVGIPLKKQWSKWPGLTYQLPVQCRVGPHDNSVITGIARAGLNARRPGTSSGAAAPPGCSGGQPDVILNAGRAYPMAMITDLWNTIVAVKETTLERRARARLASTPPTTRLARFGSRNL